MVNQSLLIKIERLDLRTLISGMIASDYIATCICYMAKKILQDNNYEGTADVRYNFSSSLIHDAFTNAETAAVPEPVYSGLMSLSSILSKHIEHNIHEFRMFDIASPSMHTLNINSMLMNSDTLILTFETYRS